MSTAKTTGQVAYEAYAGSTGWKSLVSGAPLPQWEAQAEPIRAAWEAAATAARARVVTYPPGEEWDDARVYRDDELEYSARTRCPCGSGLASLRRASFHSSWRCAAIVTGRAPARDVDPFNGKHTDAPFMFHEIKSERQPSAAGATTRPKVGP